MTKKQDELRPSGWIDHPLALVLVHRCMSSIASSSELREIEGVGAIHEKEIGVLDLNFNCVE